MTHSTITIFNVDNLTTAKITKFLNDNDITYIHKIDTDFMVWLKSLEPGTLAHEHGWRIYRFAYLLATT